MPKHIIRDVLRVIRSLLPAGLVLIVVVSMGIFFHVRSKTALENRMQQELSTAASIAALQFDADEIDAIHTPVDMERPEFRTIVQKLRQIRERVPNARFVYIFRRTVDPLVLSFVADADIGLSDSELDMDHNGAVDPNEEPGYPGESYSIRDMPLLQNEAFIHAVATDVYVDQWGALLSGFAPIFGTGGRVIAVLGIDMDAQEFIAIAESALSPLVLLLVFVVGILMTSYVGVFIWKRRLENMRELDRERSRLIDLTLHQIGTPLSGFRWWIEILRDIVGQKATTDTKQAFSELDTGIARMTEIIEALGKASKLRRREVLLQREDLNLLQMTEGCIQTYQTELNYRQQSVEFDVPDFIYVWFDRALLTEVLQALLKNAMYYSPYGSHIWISGRLKDGFAEISVRDEGIGISTEELESILSNKMRRGEEAIIKQPIGNGLGLYITKGIIERGGGEMWIESQKGKGTTVRFTLPLPKK